MIHTPNHIPHRPTNSPTISSALTGFAHYITVERQLRPKTAKNYSDAIRMFTRLIGDLEISSITLNDLVTFKGRLQQRGSGPSHMAGCLNAMKCLLRYAAEMLGRPVCDFSKLTMPKMPRRQVIYLTREELETFLASIPLRRWDGWPRISGYCFRALAETLAATGMRISEALSLDRRSLDVERREATILGKGNRQRTVFFTPRALEWIGRYLDLRRDGAPARPRPHASGDPGFSGYTPYGADG